MLRSFLKPWSTWKILIVHILKYRKCLKFSDSNILFLKWALVHVSMETLSLDTLSEIQSFLCTSDAARMRQSNRYFKHLPVLVNTLIIDYNVPKGKEHLVTRLSVREDKIDPTFENLVELCLHDTSTTFIPDTLVKLKTLECVYTNITRIPDTLIQLEILRLYGEDITSIPNTLVNLRELYCRYMDIREIPETLTKLETLKCGDCDVNSIPDTLVRLKGLDCSYNLNVESLPNTLVNLKFLNCQKTSITRIPETLINLKFLECNRYRVDIPDCITLKELVHAYDY